MGRKLVLDIDEDAAARSLMYAYLHTRGVEDTTPDTEMMWNKAQELAQKPDPGLKTYSQDAEMLKGWGRPFEMDSGRAREDITLGEIELVMGSIGVEVAGVVLRGISDERQQELKQKFMDHRAKLKASTPLEQDLSESEAS